MKQNVSVPDRLQIEVRGNVRSRGLPSERPSRPVRAVGHLDVYDIMSMLTTGIAGHAMVGGQTEQEGETDPRPSP